MVVSFYLKTFSKNLKWKYAFSTTPNPPILNYKIFKTLFFQKLHIYTETREH